MSFPWWEYPDVYKTNFHTILRRTNDREVLFFSTVIGVYEALSCARLDYYWSLQVRKIVRNAKHKEHMI